MTVPRPSTPSRLALFLRQQSLGGSESPAPARHRQSVPSLDTGHHHPPALSPRRGQGRGASGGPTQAPPMERRQAWDPRGGGHPRLSFLSARPRLFTSGRWDFQTEIHGGGKEQFHGCTCSSAQAKQGTGQARTRLQGAQRQGGEPLRMPFLALVTKKSQLPRWNSGAV